MILGELGALRSQRETNEEYKNRARERSLAPKRKGVNRNDELQNSRNIVAAAAGVEPTLSESKSDALPFGYAAIWLGRRDSDPRSRAPKARTLTTRPRPNI